MTSNDNQHSRTLKETIAATRMVRPRPRGERAVVVAMVLAFVFIVAYWAIWYGIDRNLLASSHAPAYYTFENAFPVADAWLALALALSIAGIVRRRSYAVLWTLLGGGAGVYLGCMDVLFDLENGIYVPHLGADASAPIIEGAINVITFTFAIAIVVWMWRNRTAYIHAE